MNMILPLKGQHSNHDVVRLKGIFS